MYSIAIVDDDNKDIRALRIMLERYFKENGGEYGIAEFHDGSELMSDYSPKYDIVFLDIDMKELNGMAAAKRIRMTDESTAIIFVTRMAKYAIKGYEVSALDFIVKPLDYYSFALKIKRALNYVAANRKKLIELKVGSDIQYVDENDIKYVETLSHYLIYHTVKGDFKLLGSLKSAAEQLSAESFVLCNRCYLVNMRYVAEISENAVRVGDDMLIISRYRRKEFMKALAKFWGSRG